MSLAKWILDDVTNGVVFVRATEYRVNLEFGDIDRLCAPKNTPLGRQQRLQLLGSLFEPLDGRDLAFAYEYAYEHYRKNVSSPPASEADTDDALVDAVESEILVVSGAAAGASSTLPAEPEFARIVLPGGLAIDSMDPLSHPVPHTHRFDAEDRLFGANDLIGAVPIVARVEQRTPGGPWQPAPAGLEVHFQLAEPATLPASDDAAGGPLRTKSRVKGSGGPKAYVDHQVARHPASAGDPQVDNCVVDLGGKRRPGAGRGVDYFETAARSGFNQGITPAFPTASPSSHPVAVVAQTNAEGEAGVIFRPSRQAGDRFRVRAFLDPIGPGGPASDGTETATAVRADTGTMVVWRKLEIGRYLQFGYPPATTAAAMAATGGKLDDIDFVKLAKDFSPAFVDLVVESSGVIERRTIGDHTWVAAVNHALTYTKPQPTGVSQRYDISALFPAVNATTGLIRVNTPGAYNAARGPGFSAAPLLLATRGRDWVQLLGAFMEMFMHYFSAGSIGGLVIIQAPEIHARHPSGFHYSRSGRGTVQRGCYLFYGTSHYGVHMPYDLQDNTLHELGHCLFLPHQWLDSDAAGAVSGGVPPEHDYEDYCIMSYQTNVRNDYGYCGRCNLKLRGWNTAAIAKNNR